MLYLAVAIFVFVAPAIVSRFQEKWAMFIGRFARIFSLHDMSTDLTGSGAACYVLYMVCVPLSRYLAHCDRAL